MESLKWLMIIYQKLKENNFQLPPFELSPPLKSYTLPELSADKYKDVKLLSKSDIKDCPEDDLFKHLPKTQRSFKYIDGLLEDVNDAFWPQVMQSFEVEYISKDTYLFIELTRKIFPLDIKNGSSNDPNDYRSYNAFFVNAKYQNLESSLGLVLAEDFACPSLSSPEWKGKLWESESLSDEQAERLMSDIPIPALISYAVDLVSQLEIRSS